MSSDFRGSTVLEVADSHRTCRRCGSPVGGAARFCAECGTPTSADEGTAFERVTGALFGAALGPLGVLLLHLIRAHRVTTRAAWLGWLVAWAAGALVALAVR